MRLTKHHLAQTGSLFVLVVLATSVFAGCSQPGQQSVKRASAVTPTSSLPIPHDPKPITIVKGQTATMDLGGGANLIILPGVMSPGATVSATYQHRPGGAWSYMTPTSAPIQLIANPPNSIHGLLFLEFPVPVSKITPGVDPAEQFGISTYDATTKTWTPFDSTYDAARHMVIAEIPHFSWWNPFTWDFDSLFASVAQGFGQLTGARAGTAKCSGALPNWVKSLAGVSNDADVAIHSCGEAQGNVLDIELVNNRPYGQILSYGNTVKWGWHDGASSVTDAALDRFMDANMLPTQLYLPPLTRASVGIYQPRTTSNMIFHIGPTRISIGADFLFYLLGQGIGYIPDVGACASMDLEAPLTDVSISALRDDLVAAAGCIEQDFTNLIKSGALDKVGVDKLATLFGKIKSASLLANGIAIAGGVTWKIGDLIADWIVNGNSQLGNGFSVFAEGSVAPPAPPSPPSPPPPPVVTVTVAPPPPPVVTVTVAPPPPVVTVTVAPPPPTTYSEMSPGPVHTWTNYTNAGGYQGPSVPSYTWVQIACRLTGFKTQDGNVWWYRIAQSPWSNQYYASADAFYNNGATSGSLIGTPFYDPNVPLC